MSGTRLPPGLIDLLLARTSTPVSSGRVFSVFNQALQRRLAHSAAAAAAHVRDARSLDSAIQAVQLDRSLYVSGRNSRASKERQVSPLLGPSPRLGPTTISERVQALKNAIATEESLLEQPSYSEDELISLYEDLLALPAVSKPEAEEHPQNALEECTSIVHSIADRLLQKEPRDMDTFAVRSFAQQLLQRRRESGSNMSIEVQESFIDLSSAPLHIALIYRLEEMLHSMRAVRASVTPQEAEVHVDAAAGLMVNAEWDALVRYCLLERDTLSAERVIDLMLRSQIEVSEDLVNSILEYHVDAADVEEVKRVMQKYITESPTERQRDLHVKVSTKATPLTEFPARALELLHDYETRALPAPQRSYSRVITHLFSNNTAVSHAHAWDLYSHMRYVAHPNPDAVLYTKMIRACASPSLASRGEPERALDLWHEMTVDKQMLPTAGAYSAVILACARSGSVDYIHEAFRLAKQMLDAHRDARGRSLFRPDRRLYNALLEGAKRLGDLPRVRWLLAEMVKEASSEENDEAILDSGVMVHIFHAYAAYRPPFKRSQTVLVDGENMQTSKSPQTPASQDGPSQSIGAEQTTGDITVERPSFTILPPQTHADVLREADALYARIMRDETKFLEGSSALDQSFLHVRPTTRLLNAYLSVYYSHAPLFKSIAQFKTLFSQPDSEVTRNAWTYVDALERCARAQKPDRKMALHFAREVWEAWQPVESAWRLHGENAAAASVSARLVERAYVAMIRTLSLCRELDSAMEIARSFVRQYPPSVVRDPPPKNSMRSAQTSLLGTRPLIHLVSSTSVPDDAVPPLLSFEEVEILHQRLVIANRGEDIGFVKWMCKAYEGSLRKRRDASLKTPSSSTSAVVPAEESATSDVQQGSASIGSKADGAKIPPSEV